MIKLRLYWAVASLALLLAFRSGAQTLDFSGQLSLLHISKIAKPYQTMNSGRYIPELKGKLAFPSGYGMDGEVSLNGNLQAYYQAPDSLSFDGLLKPYRVWGRFSGIRYEVRLGLQKINFGSASMLRPLMWFDRLDPRDPLQLTDGVYGLLGKYFFANNANVWLWGLLGNANTKGWETIPTRKWFPEMGFRIQYPAGQGELALSGHFRKTDPSGVPAPFNQNQVIPEYRVGLDGKWDIGPGIWFEGSWTYTRLNPPAMNHVRALTVGADYTWGLGNGITTMFEQFVYSAAETAGEAGEVRSFSALMVNYPLNLIHSLSAMVFYSWSDRSWYRFLNWQVRFDKISLHLIGFWNPDSFEIFQTAGNTSLFAGKGVQLLFVYNH